MLSEAQALAEQSKAQLNETQIENGKLRQELSTTSKDLDERTQQLLLFQRSIGILPQTSSSDDWNALKEETLKNVDLAQRLEQATIALQVMEESKMALERRLKNSSGWKDEFEPPSRSQRRTIDDISRERSRESSPMRSLPSRLMERTSSISSFSSFARSEPESFGSDDYANRKHTQSLRNEIEELTTKLELSEMQRRRLESRSSPHTWNGSAEDDGIEVRRLQRENARLQEIVDDQAEKLRFSGSGKLRPVTTESSKQSFEQNIKSLEQAKQKLMDQQNVTLRELTKCRSELDNALASSQSTERQVKSLKQQLDAEKSARQAEQNIHQQTVGELKELKVRLETTAGKLAEHEDAIKLYKVRSEDLQDKLEESEISTHNSMRSESYARDQLQEVEATLKAVLDDQRMAENTIISLQKELRTLEAKVFF